MKHRSIKQVMFHANDALKHDVYWSEEGQRFYLENKNGLVSYHNTLCSALTSMHLKTSPLEGVRGFGADYLALVTNKWTMTDNPYYAN